MVVLEEILARGEETVHEAPQAGKYTDISIYLSIYRSIDLNERRNVRRRPELRRRHVRLDTSQLKFVLLSFGRRCYRSLINFVFLFSFLTYCQ